MFGLLSPAKRDKNFCRAYTRICSSHRTESGIWLLPFHSYESTHLYLIAADAGIVNLDDLPIRACCRMAPYQPPNTPSAHLAERFCSNFSTLLAYIKLKDDAVDGWAPIQRISLLIFHRRFQRCLDFFSTLDPEFENVLARILARHSAIENSPERPTIADFVLGTGEGFSYLFSLFSIAIGRVELTPSLARIGRHIGEAICYFDMAHDFYSDQRHKSANPLPSEAHIPIALAHAKHSILSAAAVCSDEFGAHSLAAVHLKSVDDTLVLDKNTRVTKLAGALTDEVVACTPKAAFASVPVLAITDDECKMIMGVVGLFCAMNCVNKISRDCGCSKTVTTTDPRTGEVVTGPEDICK